MGVFVDPGDLLHERYAAAPAYIAFPVKDDPAGLALSLRYMPCSAIPARVAYINVCTPTVRIYAGMCSVCYRDLDDSPAPAVGHLFRRTDKDVITKTGEDVDGFLFLGHCCSLPPSYSCFVQR